MLFRKFDGRTATRLVCIIQRTLSTDPSKIRNIGIVAHIDAGKTTVTEQILVETGAIRHAGTIKHGNTTTDFLECEQDRGITVNSAFVQAHWKDHSLNIIDTPGHIDFNFEVERSLRVLDGSLVILDGTRGVEAQTVTVWKQLQKFNVPRLVFLNKLDRRLGNLELCLSSIRNVFKTEPVLLNYPVYDANNQLVGVSQTAPSLDALTATVESLANMDENIEELYFKNNFEAHRISVGDIMGSITRLHKSHKIVPVCVGSGLKRVGIDACLDYIIDLLPSPLDAMSKLPSEFKNQICGIVFKSSFDRNRGVLCQSRLYSGALKPRSRVYNIRTKTVGQVSSLFQLEAGTMMVRDQFMAGEIGVFTGCKDFRTGDMFVNVGWKDDQATLQEIVSPNSILNSTLSYSKPLFFCNVECESSLKQEKLEEALFSMTFEDPTLVLKKGSNDELLLGGNGQLHLSVVRDRLKQEHGLECKAYQFRVNYMETVVESISHTFENNSGKIEISISPCNTFLNHVTVTICSSTNVKHRELAKRTVNSCLAIGPLVGCQLVNCHVHARIMCHNETSSEQSLRDLAALTRLGMKAAFHNSLASVALSEPYADVEVEGPIDCSGPVISDFSTRLGSSDYEVFYGNDQTDFRLVGNAALAKLADYVAKIRSLSRGGATVKRIEMTKYTPMDPCDSRGIVERFKSGEMSL